MSLVVFSLVALFDVFITLLLRRYVFTVRCGRFIELAEYAFASLTGGFYVSFLHESKVFQIYIDYGDDFYRDLIWMFVVIIGMLMFHVGAVRLR